MDNTANQTPEWAKPKANPTVETPKSDPVVKKTATDPTVAFENTISDLTDDQIKKLYNSIQNENKKRQRRIISEKKKQINVLLAEIGSPHLQELETAYEYYKVLCDVIEHKPNQKDEFYSVVSRNKTHFLKCYKAPGETGKSKGKSAPNGTPDPAGSDSSTGEV